MIGKLVARLIQNCLQTLAEHVLPESQCGFRKGRRCNDIVVCLISWNHFCTFVYMCVFVCVSSPKAINNQYRDLDFI